MSRLTLSPVLGACERGFVSLPFWSPLKRAKFIQNKKLRKEYRAAVQKAFEIWDPSGAYVPGLANFSEKYSGMTIFKEEFFSFYQNKLGRKILGELKESLYLFVDRLPEQYKPRDFFEANNGNTFHRYLNLRKNNLWLMTRNIVSKYYKTKEEIDNQSIRILSLLVVDTVSIEEIERLAKARGIFSKKFEDYTNVLFNLTHLLNRYLGIGLSINARISWIDFKGKDHPYFGLPKPYPYKHVNVYYYWTSAHVARELVKEGVAPRLAVLIAISAAHDYQNLMKTIMMAPNFMLFPWVVLEAQDFYLTYDKMQEAHDLYEHKGNQKIALALAGAMFGVKPDLSCLPDWSELERYVNLQRRLKNPYLSLIEGEAPNFLSFIE